MRHHDGTTGASIISAITVGLIFLYPWAHFVPLVGNLSLIDVMWFSIFVAALFTPGIAARLLHIYSSQYGALCFVLVVFLLLSTIVSTNVLTSLAGLLQLAFALFVTVPLAAASISH